MPVGEKKKRKDKEGEKVFLEKKRSPGNVWPQKTLFMHWSNKKLNRKAFIMAYYVCFLK